MRMPTIVIPEQNCRCIVIEIMVFLLMSLFFSPIPEMIIQYDDSEKESFERPLWINFIIRTANIVISMKLLSYYIFFGIERIFSLVLLYLSLISFLCPHADKVNAQNHNIKKKKKISRKKFLQLLKNFKSKCSSK